MLSGEVLVRILLLLAIILLSGWFFVLWRAVRVRGPQPSRAVRRGGRRPADTFSQQPAPDRAGRARSDTSYPAAPPEPPQSRRPAAAGPVSAPSRLGRGRSAVESIRGRTVSGGARSGCPAPATAGATGPWARECGAPGRPNHLRLAGRILVCRDGRNRIGISTPRCSDSS